MSLQCLPQRLFLLALAGVAFAGQPGLGQPASPTASPTLSQNMEGASVLELQAALKELGFYRGPVQGYYGPLTREAVIAFQRQQRLNVTGIADAATWQALRNQASELPVPAVATESAAPPLRLVLPKNLANRGAPGQRESAASRGLCPPVKKPLTALVPAQPTGSGEAVIGLTASASPMFWFYVPYTQGEGHFLLRDPSGNRLFSAVVALPQSPGLLSVALPTGQLQTNTTYHWAFAVGCASSEDALDAMVEGWVRRVSLPARLSSRLEATAVRERLTLYAGSGLWFEVLNALIALRSLDPQNSALQRDWLALLRAVALEKVAQEPLVAASQR